MKQDIWYIVAGRVPFDDEDTISIIKANSVWQAIDFYREILLADVSVDESTELDEDGQPAIYVNQVIECGKTEPVTKFINS